MSKTDHGEHSHSKLFCLDFRHFEAIKLLPQLGALSYHGRSGERQLMIGRCMEQIDVVRFLMEVIGNTWVEEGVRLLDKSDRERESMEIRRGIRVRANSTPRNQRRRPTTSSAPRLDLESFKALDDSVDTFELGKETCLHPLKRRRSEFAASQPRPPQRYLTWLCKDDDR